MLELHVWGPAFSLPSIDAHCLAAIAYLQQAVPRGKWELIASSDPTLSPTNELPALRNGDIWIGGFRNIFHYIAQYSSGEWILDAGLREQEGADCIAFSSFVEYHGQPLVDLSLYVSTQNYTTVTRALYNTIQSFPLPYITPPTLRAAAKARTAHLGLSSLDIDTEEGEPRPEQSIIPESLRRPKSTVTSVLAASPETNAQIRLDALATNFLEPLNNLRGKKQFFVSDNQFTSLDCLSLGYLSLMLVPELPQPWIARTMRKKFPDLCAWTQGMRTTVFGGPVTLADAFLRSSESGVRSSPKTKGKWRLPWKEPENRGVVAVGSAFALSLVNTVPVVGQLRKNIKMRQHGGKTSDDAAGSSSWEHISAIGSAIAGLGLVAGYMFHQGLISSPWSEEEKESNDGGLDAFGEAGAALSVYANSMDAHVQQQRMMERNYSHGEPVVKVDVNVNRGAVGSTETVS